MTSHYKCIFVSIVVVAASSAAAQEVSSPIEGCRLTTDDKDGYIACLEGVINGLLGGGQTAMSDTAVATSATEAPAAVALSPAQEESIAQLPPGAIAQTIDEQSTPTGLGAEQVARKDDGKRTKNRDKETLRIAVSEFATTSSGDTLFILENGQIWRKKKSERLRGRLIGSRDYSVKISKGAFSGYKMRIQELGETVTVERVK